MSDTFKNRLNRIETSAANAPSTTPAPEFVGRLFPREHLPLQPGDPTEAAVNFSTKYRRQIIRNLATGFIWMAITGFFAMKHGQISIWLEASPMFAPDYATYMTVYYMALLISFGSFAVVAHNASDQHGLFAREATAPVSILFGGVAGLLVGLGPINLVHYAGVFTNFMNG